VTGIQHERVWAAWSLDPGRWYSWSATDKTIFLRRRGEELLVLEEASRDGTVGGGLEACGGEVSARLEEELQHHEKHGSRRAYLRFHTGGEDELRFSPKLPDRPVVVFFRTPQRIPPGKRADFTLYLPVHCGVYAGGDKEQHLLMEVPSQTLTSTWFGDMLSGELCYGLSAALHAGGPDGGPPEDGYGVFFTRVGLHLRNSSTTVLDFSKINIHTEHLSLYRDGEGMCSNEISIDFSGTDQVSQVHFGKRAPKGSGNVETLASARVDPESGFIKRSFSFLKSLTEM
jgi:hypothetical protein